MKTLFVAYRVTDLENSLDFYTSLGYVEVGSGPIGDGVCIALLRFPDEPVATLELVHRPGGGRVDVGGGFDHLAIQVDALAATLKRLREAGLEPEPVRYPGGPGTQDVVAHRPGRLPDRAGSSGRPGTPTRITEADFP